MKKIPSVIIIIISIAAVYYLLVAPAFCRGTVKITVENTTAEILLIVAINDKEVNQSVKPKGRTTITYKVDSCPYILLEFDSALLSDPMDLEVVTYIERKRPLFCVFPRINIPRHSRGFFIYGQSPMLLAARHVAQDGPPSA